MLITSIHFNEIPAEKFATFADACAAGETLNKTIVVSSILAVEADLTVDRSLVIKPGGRLTIASGVTLTINGPLSCGLFQCFSGDGSVVFSSGSITEVYPEWFGAVQLAIDCAITSNVGTVRFSAKTYTFTDTLTITTNNGLKLQGSGRLSTILDFNVPSGNGLNCIYSAAGGVKFITIADLTIRDSQTTATEDVLLNLEGGNTGESPSQTGGYIELERLYIDAFKTSTGSAIRLRNLSSLAMRDVTIIDGIDCKYGLEIDNDISINTGVISLSNCAIRAGETALYVNRTEELLDTFYVSGCYFGNRLASVNTPKEVILINSVNCFKFTANHLEADGGASYATIKCTGKIGSIEVTTNHFSAKQSGGVANKYGVEFDTATIYGGILSNNEFMNYTAGSSGGAAYRFTNTSTISGGTTNPLMVRGGFYNLTTPYLLSIEAGGNADAIWAGLEYNPMEVIRYNTPNNATAFSFIPPISEGFMSFIVNNLVTHSGILGYRAEAAGAASVKIGGGANFAVATGILTGTTGTNGNITVSPHTDGKIYVENRQGAQIVVYFHQTSATKVNSVLDF